MHSGLIRVCSVAHQVLTHKYEKKECFYDSFSVETLCSQIETDHYQHCQMKSHRKLSFAFLALLGEATMVVAHV